MTKQLNTLSLFFLLGFAVCFSQTKMPAFFSNNMILQQQDTVAIWGTDLPDTVIEIKTSWGITKTTKTMPDGTWKTDMQTKKASFDKHDITVTGSSTIKILNVLIGEVWFCSGQSNMEMPMDGLSGAKVNGSTDLISNSKNSNIRLFNTQRSASLSLEADVTGSWEETNPETVKSFSAIGYLFGKKLFEELQVPIGIIEAAWGGSPIECWLPKSRFENHPEIKVPDTISENENKQKRPTFLYNAMVHPFKNYAIKGFLWYQGEANRKNADLYKGYMKTLINSWRDQWQQKNLPFYLVQIAPYDYNIKYKSKKDAFGSNLVREAQTFTANEITNTGIVVTTDVGECKQIHPAEKLTIAKRLANWALTNQYGVDGLPYRSPEFKSITLKNKKAVLDFSFYGNDPANLVFDNQKKLQDFVISGKDGVFYPAKVKINKNQTLTISSDKVKEPVAVRYGFVDCLEGSLFSKAGLPVSPFRTDDWLN